MNALCRKSRIGRQQPGNEESSRYRDPRPGYPGKVFTPTNKDRHYQQKSQGKRHNTGNRNSESCDKKLPKANGLAVKNNHRQPNQQVRNEPREFGLDSVDA